MTRPTLVIADDDANMRALVRETLRGELPDAIEAADGRELFWQLLRSSYGVAGHARDLVIVADVRMPAYSGLDVLDAWHQEHARSPIVMITAFPDDRVRARAARLAAAVVAKPFSRAQLQVAVSDALRRARTEEVAR
ncbi:MAG: response regulator [Acidobacteriota bacterium]